MKTQNDYDVVIVGAGVVGLTLACALAQYNLLIAVVESRQTNFKWTKNRFDLRVSAINRASEHLFRTIKTWDFILGKGVTPYKRMFVWDQLGQGEIEFNCNEVDEPNLGYIIEHRVLLKTLYERLKTVSNIHLLCPNTPQKFIREGESTLLFLNDKTIRTKLLIGADGAHSWVREQMGTVFSETPYKHTALVTTVHTAKPHQHTAWQCFLPKGPLALLPLLDPYYCSVVWSTQMDHAHQLQSMDEDEFNRAMSEIFKKHLGAVKRIDKLISFPLYERHVKNYIRPGIVLVGDAAHTIHPLAGQGMNLGLQDAAALVKVIADALEKQRSFANYSVLRRYERWRKTQNWEMIVAMRALKHLFAGQVTWLAQLRSGGLRFLNKTNFIKQMLMNRAMGKFETDYRSM